MYGYGPNFGACDFPGGSEAGRANKHHGPTCPGGVQGRGLVFKLWTGAVPSSQRCREAMRWPGPLKAPEHRPQAYLSRDVRPWPRIRPGGTQGAPAGVNLPQRRPHSHSTRRQPEQRNLPGVTPETSPAIAPMRDAGLSHGAEAPRDIRKFGEASWCIRGASRRSFPVEPTGQAWIRDPAESQNGAACTLFVLICQGAADRPPPLDRESHRSRRTVSHKAETRK